MADNKSCEGNKCKRCGQLIISTVRTDPIDKPSARIICDDCKINNMSDLNFRINVSDALRGLKAIQREAKKATVALKELENISSDIPEHVRNYGKSEGFVSSGKSGGIWFGGGNE